MTQILLCGSSWNRVGDSGSILAAPARHAGPRSPGRCAGRRSAGRGPVGASGRTGRAAPGHTSPRPSFSPVGEGQDAGGRVAEDPPHGSHSGGTRESHALPRSAQSSPGWHAVSRPISVLPHERVRPRPERVPALSAPRFHPLGKEKSRFSFTHLLTRPREKSHARIRWPTPGGPKRGLWCSSPLSYCA